MFEGRHAAQPILAEDQGRMFMYGCCCEGVRRLVSHEGPNLSFRCIVMRLVTGYFDYAMTHVSCATNPFCCFTPQVIISSLMGYRCGLFKPNCEVAHNFCVINPETKRLVCGDGKLHIADRAAVISALRTVWCPPGTIPQDMGRKSIDPVSAATTPQVAKRVSGSAGVSAPPSVKRFTQRTCGERLVMKSSVVSGSAESVCTKV